MLVRRGQKTQGRGSPSLPPPPNNSGCGDCPAPGFRDCSSSIHKLTGACAKKQGRLPSPPGSRTVPAPTPPPPRPEPPRKPEAARERPRVSPEPHSIHQHSGPKGRVGHGARGRGSGLLAPYPCEDPAWPPRPALLFQGPPHCPRGSRANQGPELGQESQASSCLLPAVLTDEDAQGSLRVALWPQEQLTRKADGTMWPL